MVLKTFQRNTATEPQDPESCDQFMSNGNLNSHSGDFQYKQLMAQRRKKIEEAAYFKAERRGFTPGLELQDWLEAEKEVDDASRPTI